MRESANTIRFVRDLWVAYGTLTIPHLPSWILLLAALAVPFYIRANRMHLPPGPPQLPLIGNLHQISKTYWLDFARWNRKYGPVVSLNFGGVSVIVVGTVKAAADLMDRRSASYSGRPNNVVAGQLLTGGMVFTFHPMDEFWRKNRRASQEVLSKITCVKYQYIQESEAAHMISSLLEAPEELTTHLRRGLSSIMTRILYGLPSHSSAPNKTKQTTPDPEATDLTDQVFDFASRTLAASAPGAFLVDYFTWMMYLPRWLTPWRGWAEDWFKKHEEMAFGLMQGVRDRMSEGTQQPCVAGSIIENQEKSGLSDREGAWLPTTLYAGGLHTTIMTLEWVFLALMAHPEVQKRAHAELDEVVGRDRLPTFGDRERLPYIQAICMEVFRWRTFGPVGIPHELEADDWYEGHFFPKGSMIIYNLWSMHRDTSVYGPNTDDFIPGRFIDEKTSQLKDSVKDSKDMNHFSFGMGRRICPGRYLAMNSIFIVVAQVLWAFSLELVKGEPIPSLELEDHIFEGLANRTRPYKCNFSPRFSQVREVVGGEVNT